MPSVDLKAMLNGTKILPILSDPTSEDGDGDGYIDYYEIECLKHNYLIEFNSQTEEYYNESMDVFGINAREHYFLKNYNGSYISTHSSNLQPFYYCNNQKIAFIPISNGNYIISAYYDNYTNCNEKYLTYDNPGQIFFKECESDNQEWIITPFGNGVIIICPQSRMALCSNCNGLSVKNYYDIDNSCYWEIQYDPEFYNVPIKQDTELKKEVTPGIIKLKNITSSLSRHIF